MFNNYKKGPALFVLAALSITMGCQKEEEPLDLESPAVTLEVSGNPAKLYNEVTLTSTATDNGTIERVAFYANNDSIGQATTEPYELSWNTKEVEDGPYMLKVVAYDASGNKSEAAKEVTIKNTLLTVQVENGYLRQDERGEEKSWIFLSDKDGKLVGEPQQLTDGSSLNWQRPADFYSDTVYLSRLRHDSYMYGWTPQKSTYITVYTYADFTLEEVFFSAGYSPDSIGKVDITVENNFDGVNDYEFETMLPYSGISTWSTGNVITYTVETDKSSQKGFSSYEKVTDRADQHLREKYYRFDELEAGNAYTFHTNEYTAMEGHMISFPFTPTYAYVNTSGYLNQERQGGYSLDNMSVWDNASQAIKTFSANDFPYIRTYITAETGNKYFYFSTMEPAPEVVDVPDFSTAVQTSDMKTIEVITNGTFDVGNGFWIYTEESDTEYLRARRSIYFSSKSGASYVLPEVPASLLELYPSLNKPMEHSFSWAGDNEALDSYEENLKYWFTESYNGLDYLNYSGLYTYPENAGGRKKPSEFAKGREEDFSEKGRDLHERGILSY